MRQLFKKINLVVLPVLTRCIFKLIIATSRIIVHDEGGARYLPNNLSGKSRIFAMWHQHLLSGAYFLRKGSLTAIVSQSRDGEYFTRLIAPWGYGFIRGSSSRGGKEAYAESLELLKNNGKLWIAPDGPRGPYHVVKWGVIRMAFSTGTMIVPLGFCYSKKIQLKSWDKFQIPLPFCKIIVVLGRPFESKGGLEEENIRSQSIELENRINQITAKAEMLMESSQKV